jgi:L-threonylcarbamoyladenylate synthase
VNIIATNQATTQEIIDAAVATLAAGGLILFPTETTYGAGVDATNPQAVQKLLNYKSRREGKPLSIAVTDINMASEYVEINESARKLYGRFLPGPVTVVSKGKDVAAPGVESEFGTLGVRIPDYDLILQIVAAFGKPITATSANASGKKRPYSIGDVMTHISNKQKSLLDLVIDAGTLPDNPPSTVIDTTLSTPVAVRKGTISQQEKMDTGKSLTLYSESEQETKAIAGKVMLKHWDTIKNAGVIIGLDGPLGVGKTIFTKGVAEFLKIEDTITSPTYTYIEEYDFNRHNVEGNLYHLDVWKIDSAQQFELLDFASLLGAKKVIVIEWWQQVSGFVLPLVMDQKVITINVSETDTAVTENSPQRKLDIQEFDTQKSE